MRIETADFGPQEIDPDSIIEFPKGIPGFENNTRFKLFAEDNAQHVLHLQSVSDPNLSFSIVDPSELNVFYEFQLDDDELELLGTDNPQDMFVLVFTYRNPPPENTSDEANGLAFSFMNPLIINPNGQKGLMKVLSKTSQQITIKAE